MRRARWRHAAAWGIIGIALLVGACNGRRGLLPKSGGRSYEVLLVSDTNNIVRNVLESDAKGLPQSEPEFDVSSIDSSELNATLRLARNIVTVSINPDLYTTTRIRYEKNVYAQPQMAVHVSAPSTKALQKGLVAQGNTLLALLKRAETNATLLQLEHQRNAKAERMIQEKFGHTLWIPMDMLSSKQGKDFVWLSNNSPTGMQNIVVYRSRPAKSTREFVAIRDSVMLENIKGETDAMHMKTVAETVAGIKTKEKGGEITIYRGLWEMEGDDMGGPFVSHSIGDLTVEAFVFAPGMKKRNKLRQIEAALYTLK
ncbi:MAG: DUF4837 family protein [Prevotella sp.]|jgi:hypothetical protein